ncbi:hypothetical protein APHAL10511_004988 [Amanita phalloides]|nr:hypothetical protein APHAL10511_004988 [Amanita phalloides]
MGGICSSLRPHWGTLPWTISLQVLSGLPLPSGLLATGGSAGALQPMNLSAVRTYLVGYASYNWLSPPSQCSETNAVTSTTAHSPWVLNLLGRIVLVGLTSLYLLVVSMCHSSEATEKRPDRTWSRSTTSPETKFFHFISGNWGRPPVASTGPTRALAFAEILESSLRGRRRFKERCQIFTGIGFSAWGPVSLSLPLLSSRDEEGLFVTFTSNCN